MAPPSGDMYFIDHLNELRNRFLRIIIFTLGVVIFTTIFGLQNISINHINFYIIYPTVYNNIASQVTLFLSHSLLPKGVSLIQTSPGQSLYAQIYVSILLGISCSIPLIVKEIFGFISPAISEKTKKIATSIIIIPVFLLFVSGIIFAFYLAIPTTLDFLYQYGQSLGVITFLNINDFINFILQFFIAFGIAFQLPLIMYFLSLTGIFGLNFWIKNFKYAIIAIVIFGALITPDGSGLTMWFVSIPMIILYFIGMFIIKVKNNSRTNYT